MTRRPNRLLTTLGFLSLSLLGLGTAMTAAPNRAIGAVFLVPGLPRDLPTTVTASRVSAAQCTVTRWKEIQVTRYRARPGGGREPLGVQTRVFKDSETQEPCL